jgi:DNA-binding response OmpR family regulator
MASDARVLVIEDNDALRVMMFTILRHQPLQVDTAASGSDALQHIQNCDYALILIDLDLPGDESLRFLRQFRSQRTDANTFVLAVRDPKNDNVVAPEWISAILNKPLEIDTLAEVVRECAAVVPPPPDPLPCPPAESDVRSQIERGGSMLSN